MCKPWHEEILCVDASSEVLSFLGENCSTNHWNLKIMKFKNYWWIKTRNTDRRHPKIALPLIKSVIFTCKSSSPLVKQLSFFKFSIYNNTHLWLTFKQVFETWFIPLLNYFDILPVYNHNLEATRQKLKSGNQGLNRPDLENFVYQI